jgi:hypothetical protein
VNGDSPPEGSQIIATNGDVLVEDQVTDDGGYSLAIVIPEGDPERILFLLAAPDMPCCAIANQTAQWQAGWDTELDLTFIVLRPEPGPGEAETGGN